MTSQLIEAVPFSVCTMAGPSETVLSSRLSWKFAVQSIKSRNILVCELCLTRSFYEENAMFKFYSYRSGFKLLEKYIIGQCRLNWGKCVAFKLKKM